MTSADAFGLDRFVAAQQAHDTYDEALEELRAGRKTSHWMWFVFPQIAGLGHSAMAQRFAIASLDEARAYFRHETLGPRLRECVAAMLDLPPTTEVVDVLGAIDATKLRSSMTLFSLALPDEAAFGAVLDQFFDGARDAATESILSAL